MQEDGKEEVGFSPNHSGQSQNSSQEERDRQTRVHKMSFLFIARSFVEAKVIRKTLLPSLLRLFSVLL